MKNNILSLFICIVISLLHSCYHEDFSDSNLLSKEEKELVSQFDVIGIKHNEVMRQIYDKFLENANIANVSSSEILAMTLSNTKEATLLSIASTNTFSPKLKSINNNIDEIFIDSLLTMGVKLALSSETVKLKNTPTGTIDSYGAVKELLSNKSADLNTYLRQLLTITEKINTIEQYNAEINSLIVSAMRRLDGEEIEIFLCASSTAKYSYEYWHNNLHNWKNVLLLSEGKNIVRLKSSNPESITQDPNFTKMRNDIIQWDISGALGGAIAGAITGPGPGIGLCAFAGGVGASSTAAINDIFDSYGKSAWEGFKNELKDKFGW